MELDCTLMIRDKNGLLHNIMLVRCSAQAAKHLSAGLRSRAARAGLQLVELDVSRPIADQGFFVAIVHKAVGDAGAPKLHAMPAIA